MRGETVMEDQRGASVLVVDDQHDARHTLGEILLLEGYSVATAEDGVAAWDYLETHLESGLLPNAILLDLMMPRMNGWEFRARQLNDPRFRNIAVVVVSGADDTEQSLSQLGAAAYFVKPIDVDLLIAVVDRYCERLPPG